ncbi:MAG: cbb3-type cytochrome c oxidase subunit I, partial [Thermoleophilia bacterium]|nr:cbb3-type cytochrome c oxidase subunit I [Thermoleophilia bacterium]
MRNGSINVRPLSALVGIIAGWVAGAVIMSAFRLWSGGLDWNNSGADWKAVLGLGGSFLRVSVLGAVLGLLVSAAGVAAFRVHGLLRGLAGMAVGFAFGAAVTMLIRMAFGLQAYSEGPIVVIGIVSAYFAYIGGLGGWYSWLWYARGAATEVDDHANHGSRGDWKRFFIFNTDHKVIGLQYLVVVFFFMLSGGAFAEGIRAELANPALQFFKDGGQYNEALSLHGVIMLFLFIIPVFSGIANYIVPIMLGAIDMAYPKLNALSFWT